LVAKLKINHRETSTKMNPESMLDLIFPTQDKYRAVTEDLLNLLIEKSQRVSGRQEIEVKSAVSQLEQQGHNRHTVYKVLREHLVPQGVVTWKRFEGTVQLSNKFGNALRRLSVSWKNFVKNVEQGKQDQISSE